MVTRKTKGVIAIPAALVGFGVGSAYGKTFEETCTIKEIWNTLSQAEQMCCTAYLFTGVNAWSALNACKTSHKSAWDYCALVKSNGIAGCDSTQSAVEKAVAENKKIDDKYAIDLATCGAETPSRDKNACFTNPTGSCVSKEGGPVCYTKDSYWSTDLWGSYMNYSGCVASHENYYTNTCMPAAGNCNTQQAAMDTVESNYSSCLASS
jgi:hypothetical protein